MAIRRFCDYALELYKAGASSRSLARYFNVSKQTIQRGIRFLGQRLRCYNYDATSFPNLGDEYKNGQSITELAKKYRIGYSAAKRMIKELVPVLRSAYERSKRMILDHHAFTNLTCDTAYWAGFLMADGCVTGTPNAPRIQLTLSSVDINHVFKFKEFLKAKSEVKQYLSKTSYGYAQVANFSVVSVEIAKDLSSLGVTPRKSLTACASDIVKWHCDFWRGVIDGDGSLFFKDKHLQKRPVICLVGSQALLEQFHEFVLYNLGSRMSINVKPKHGSKIYSMRTSDSKAVAITDMLYGHGGVSLNRKQKLANEFRRLRLAKALYACPSLF